MDTVLPLLPFCFPLACLQVVSAAVVSTCDVFSTSLALAGVEPPTDRFIDGMDLSEVWNLSFGIFVIE
eukprot:m.585594 g.585594  ORF g.585594 m.585594 type:complete len:68 (-) comp57970_c0_seq37:659-862(-)